MSAVHVQLLLVNSTSARHVVDTNRGLLQRTAPCGHGSEVAAGVEWGTGSPTSSRIGSLALRIRRANHQTRPTTRKTRPFAFDSSQCGGPTLYFGEPLLTSKLYSQRLRRYTYYGNVDNFSYLIPTSDIAHLFYRRVCFCTFASPRPLRKLRKDGGRSTNNPCH